MELPPTGWSAHLAGFSNNPQQTNQSTPSTQNSQNSQHTQSTESTQRNHTSTFRALQHSNLEILSNPKIRENFLNELNSKIGKIEKDRSLEQLTNEDLVQIMTLIQTESADAERDYNCPGSEHLFYAKDHLSKYNGEYRKRGAESQFQEQAIEPNQEDEEFWGNNSDEGDFSGIGCDPESESESGSGSESEKPHD